MSPNTQALVDRYENGIHDFEDALRGVTPEIADRSPGQGKWTIRQLAAHLADSELVGAVRMRWVAAQPGKALAAYDQDAWAETLVYQKLPLETCLELFRAARKATAAVLRNLPESAWSNTGLHEERGSVTLQHFVELHVEHLEHHGQQIRDLRRRFAAAAA